jgi:hypothetical protein
MYINLKYWKPLQNIVDGTDNLLVDGREFVYHVYFGRGPRLWRALYLAAARNLALGRSRLTHPSANALRCVMGYDTALTRQVPHQDVLYLDMRHLLTAFDARQANFALTTLW